MGKKYLFITQSDLSMEDSNGRTLRDVFGYVENSDIYSFCTQRKNPLLSSNQAFCIDQNRLFKKKQIHRNVDENKITNAGSTKKLKKNPLTCLLRNLAWNTSFIFWRKKFKKWIKKVNPDVLVFNPGDFLFMHKIATYASRVTKKKIVVYNTEDYYFKTWNYLHDERGFKRLYPLFRRRLVKAYNKSFSYAKLIIHNTEGLLDIYAHVFANVKHILVYHPSNLKVNLDCIDSTSIEKEFYYCGALDKGRDQTLFLFAKLLEQSIPNARIIINGSASKELLNKFKNFSNIDYQGFIEYKKVAEILKKRIILLSINSLDVYQLKDKKHAFSTKLSDYISSFNIIFHVSLPNDEYEVLKNNKLGFVSSNETEITKNLSILAECLDNNNNPFKENMIAFYENYLNPVNTYELLYKEVE